MARSVKTPAGSPKGDPLPAIRPAATVKVDFTGASARSEVLGVSAVRLLATEKCYIKVGTADTIEASNADMPLEAEARDYIHLNPDDRIAVIARGGAASGILHITKATEREP